MAKSQKILDEALHETPEKRAEFVAEACGGEASLYVEVKSLL